MEGESERKGRARSNEAVTRGQKARMKTDKPSKTQKKTLTKPVLSLSPFWLIFLFFFIILLSDLQCGYSDIILMKSNIDRQQM